MRNEGVYAFCGGISTFSEWDKLVFTAGQKKKVKFDYLCAYFSVTNRFFHWKGRKKSKRCKKTFKYVNLRLSKGKKWVLLDYKPFLDRFLQAWLTKWSKFVAKIGSDIFQLWLDFAPSKHPPCPPSHCSAGIHRSPVYFNLLFKWT